MKDKAQSTGLNKLRVFFRKIIFLMLKESRDLEAALEELREENSSDIDVGKSDFESN